MAEDVTTDLSGVAERLRAVLEARRYFLRMWAIDRDLIDPAIDRVARDLEQAGPPPGDCAAPDA